MIRIWCALLFVTGMIGMPASAAEREPTSLTVSAAADLAQVFPEIARGFTQKTGIRVEFNFASTRKLATQIEQGAPVDFFAAADRQSVERLSQLNLVVPGTISTYAFGRLVLCVPPDSKLRLKQVRDLASAGVRHIALANPEHAPYGRAAREALQAQGLWDALRDRLVPADNVQHALQLVATGTADAGLVALSLVIQDAKVRWVLVPEKLHRPIEQTLCVVKGTKAEAAARQFAAYVCGPEGRAILARYGFRLPKARR